MENLTPYEHWQSLRFTVIIKEIPVEDEGEKIITAAVIDFENENNYNN